jgi:endo-1,4-beta-xylanase
MHRHQPFSRLCQTGACRLSMTTLGQFARPLAVAATLLALLPATPVAKIKPSDVPSLAREFARYFKFGFGGVCDLQVRSALYAEDPVLTRIVAEQSNIIGINAFYPDRVHPNRGTWSWEHADALIAFADRHQIRTKRAHVLLWPFGETSTLEWMLKSPSNELLDRASALDALRAYVRTVMGRYKGRIDYWDVVNEAADPTQPDGLRQGLWKQVVGPDIVEQAFRIAREADPRARLFYNDTGEWLPARRTAIVQIVKRLKDQGLIDGLGLQQHVSLTEPSARVLDETLAIYAQLGVELHVTELDVETNPSDRDTVFTSEQALVQARRYRELFDVYKKYAGKITAVMTWNVTDKTSWRRFVPRRRMTWPLLFDDDGKPKPAFWAIIRPE